MVRVVDGSRGVESVDGDCGFGIASVPDDADFAKGRRCHMKGATGIQKVHCGTTNLASLLTEQGTSTKLELTQRGQIQFQPSQWQHGQTQFHHVVRRQFQTLQR